MSHRFDSSRMEALSDGIFAIAITLLVLEISVPDDAFDHLGDALADQWPSYLAYVTSFLTIGCVWFLHHAMFRVLDYADRGIARMNLLLLMVVAFLPFPTGLLAEAVAEEEGERTAVLFYGGVLVVILLLLAAMCRYVAGRPALLQEGVRADELRALAARLTPGLASYGVVLALAAVAPRATAFGFFAVAVIAVFRLTAGPRE